MDLIKLKNNHKELKKYARRFYHNPQHFLEYEFLSDFKLFMYTKRLIRRYINKHKIDLRIVLNHIITLCNLFGTKPTGVILLFYCGEDLWPQVKSFLSYLSILPQDLSFVHVKEDETITKYLKTL